MKGFEKHFRIKSNEIKHDVSATTCHHDQMQITMCWVTVYKKYNVGKCVGISEGEINKRMSKISIQIFSWNGDFLSVQSRTIFPYNKHLINKALKNFPRHFLQEVNLLVKIVRCLVVFVL